jgi:hypothetical protein
MPRRVAVREAFTIASSSLKILPDPNQEAATRGRSLFWRRGKSSPEIMVQIRSPFESDVLMTLVGPASNAYRRI